MCRKHSEQADRARAKDQDLLTPTPASGTARKDTPNGSIIVASSSGMSRGTMRRAAAGTTRMVGEAADPSRLKSCSFSQVWRRLSRHW